MKNYARVLASAALLALVALLASVTTAAAASVAPSVVAGNPPCDDGLKIEPVTSGTYGPVTIVVNGSTFDFTTDGNLVTAVVVKGGPQANLYNYPAPGVTSDTNLVAPTNDNNGKPYGLSHLCFFFGGEKGEPDPKK